MKVRWGTLCHAFQCHAVRSLPEHALSCTEGVRMTWRFLGKNNKKRCHSERSELSHRLHGVTPWIVAVALRTIAPGAMQCDPFRRMP
jgi:hypothetical protein